MARTQGPLRLVVIYSRRDSELLRELLDHLSPLGYQGIIEIWYDRDLDPGSGWREEIEVRLKSAEIVMVLVSASCLASTFCRAEIGLALDLRNRKGLRVIPVKLHEVDWEGEPLSELQVLPKHGGALSASANRHAELAEIARAIRRLASSEILVEHQLETGRRKNDTNEPARGRPRQALEEARKENPLGLSVVNDRALAMADLGEFSSARALLEPAIQSARTTKSCDLAVLLSNYAHILRATGELEAARTTLEEALTLSLPSDPALAIRLDRLAGVLRELEEPEFAQELANQALTISLQAHGEKHPAVAVRHNTLGLIWADLGEPERAIREFEDALSILLACRDEDHPSVAVIRGNLALALRDLGDLEVARHLAERALADDSKAYPDPHPSVATDLNTLALILRDQGDTSAATRCLRKAQEIFSQVLGDLHPSTRAVRDNLRIAVLRAV